MNYKKTTRNRTKRNRTKRNRTKRNRRTKHKRKARGDIPPQHSCFSCAKEFEQGETKYMYDSYPYCEHCALLIIPEQFEKKENENKCVVCNNIINVEDMFDVTTYNHKGKILLAHKQCLSSALGQ